MITLLMEQEDRMRNNQTTINNNRKDKKGLIGKE